MTRTKRLSLTGLGALSTLGLGALGLVLVAGCADEPTVVAPVGEPPVQLESPAPVTGGTLLVLNDLQRAVVSDTDMDQIVIVDLDSMEAVHTIALDKGAEPGRVIAGPDDTAYVALRRGGEVLRLDVNSGAISHRNAVCAAPRGMAYDGGQTLHVACAGGELVSLNADLNGAPQRSLKLDYDLRDVVLSNGKLLVSRFRAAEVLSLNATGDVNVGEAGAIHRGFTREANGFRHFTGSVAWHMVPIPSGQVMMLHQRGTTDSISIETPEEIHEHEVPTESSYGGSSNQEVCIPGIVHAAVSFFDANGVNTSAPGAGGIGEIVSPVAVAVSSTGERMAVVGAGSDMLFTTSLDRARNSDRMQEGCFPNPIDTEVKIPGEPVAVAYSGNAVVVQTRQPAMLKLVLPETGELLSEMRLPGPDRRNWGHALFHKAASDNSSISCASCHPEGRDDGRVWNFTELGPRRTQTMSGGVMETMPLHWDGDMTTLHDLMGEVFVNRMGGTEQPEDRIEAMGEWMNGVQAVPNSLPIDTDAVARGKALYESAEVGCASCHNGEMYTNNADADVGTGKKFQVPMLVGIAHRAPFMHDGCATTLKERFTNASYCTGGDSHGQISQLDDDQINDLVAYLETL